MRTREKVILLLIGATVVLGALVSFVVLDNEVEANYIRWLFSNKLSHGLSSPLQFLTDELPDGTLFYGGLAIFAVVMTLIVLKMIRDGEIQALRSVLTELRSEKHAAEHLLQEQVWKGKHEQHAKDLAMRDLEESIGKIEMLLRDLNNKETELKARDAELTTLRSSVAIDATPRSNSPAERLLHEEINKKNEILEAKETAVRNLEQRLNTQGRLWENRVREKDALLKERENELKSLRAEMGELNGRLQQLESAKKRAESRLQEELRQKKEVLAAEAQATKAEEKRFGEKIQNLESELAERDKAIRQRDLEIGGFRRRVKELETASARADHRLQELSAQAEKDSRERDRLLQETEQRLGGSVQSLQADLAEKSLLLQVRDGEVSSLKLEAKALSQRLSEMAAAKVRAEEMLQEDLKKARQQHDAASAAYGEQVSRADAGLKLLTGQLAERETLLKRRAEEIEALEQRVHAVSQTLREAGDEKERFERTLREELKREQLQRASNEAAQRELAQRYEREVQALKGLLNEEQDLRKGRDEEIKSLKGQNAALAEQLAKVGSAKDQAASLLQQTIRKEKEVLQANDSAIREIEEGFRAKIAALEQQLQTKQEVVGSRDSEVAELRSELLSVNQRMTDLASAKERAESLFEEAVRDRTDLLQTKEAGLKELEEGLSGKIRQLESHLRQKEEGLLSREAELNTLKGRLDELASAKEQATHALRDDLRRTSDLLGEKEAALGALEERFERRINSLESELGEKQELLATREDELRKLLAKVNEQTNQLSQLRNSREHAARTKDEELRRLTELSQSKDEAIKALEDRLNEGIGSLQSQLGQKQQLLETRDAELDALMSKVNELTHKLDAAELERERTERLTQEEFREKAQLVESKEASISEIEERFGAKIDSLERQIAERQKLLETSGVEMDELRERMNLISERLNEAEAAKMNLEGLLQQARSKAEHSHAVKATFEKRPSERVNGEGHGLETLLSEREQLLQARDKLIENLMTELKEKKTQLAKQEIEVWKNIERREAWKHRLSKIGIRFKD